MAVARRNPISKALWVITTFGIPIFALVFVIALALLVASPFMSLDDVEIDLNTTVQLDSHVIPVTAPALGIEAARLRNIRASLVFPPRREQLTAGLMGLVVMLGTAIWVLNLFRSLLRSLGDGQPSAGPTSPASA